MVNPKETWAKPIVTAGGEPSKPFADSSSAQYADTDRRGTSELGETRNIQLPQNLVSDPVWGINAPAGGINSPETPEIPVTKGE
jgi:hypothetical protein